MVAPDKRMGKADLESFLNQQFPKSKEVNNLLEQIIASKNAMEKSMGEEIPSFYGTISRLISAHTVNGISDWVSSNGQVNINRINKAAEIAKKEFQVQKRREQEEQAKNNQQRNYSNGLEQSNDEKIDLNDITLDKFIDITKNIEKNWRRMNDAERKSLVEMSDKMAGTKEAFQLIQQAMFDPTILKDSKTMEKIKDGIHSKLYNKLFNEGNFNQGVAQDIVFQKLKVLGELAGMRKIGEITAKQVQGVLKDYGLDGEEYTGLIDVEHILSLSYEDLNNLCEETKEKINKLDLSGTLEKNEQANSSKITSPKISDEQQEGIANFVETGESRLSSIDSTENIFDNIFAGVIDLAERAEEMGLPVQEGDGYTTFFNIEEGQQEHGQAGIDGQDIGEVDAGRQDGGVEEIAGQAIGDDAEKQTMPNAMGIIGQLQNAAREEPNDYTQEDTYQTPTLDNLEDDKKGGILGFFSKIKDAIQARFAKKPEQKRLNPSVEQRIDENGWNVKTYDGNGTDLMPRGTGLRNAMVRFAENTIGKVAKLTTKAPRSAEPINTPYVIPTNVQKREDKQQVVTKDKTNQWAVDPSRLSPLEHGKKDKDQQVQGDGER